MARKKRRVRGLHTSKRVTWKQKVREYVWPSMGPWAWLKWMKLTLLRQAHQPHQLALGFAVGVWAVFFPVLGTHMAISILVCWLLGGSVIAAIAGNWVGNPWTYPLVWWASHKIGVWLLGLHLVTKDTVHEVDPLHVFELWEHFEKFFWHVLWPMLVGGQIIGIPFGIATYFVVFYAVVGWNVNRRKRRMAA